MIGEEIHQQLRAAVLRARALFGAGDAVIAPPGFALPADLEADLGRGAFDGPDRR